MMHSAHPPPPRLASCGLGLCRGDTGRKESDFPFALLVLFHPSPSFPSVLRFTEVTHLSLFPFACSVSLSASASVIPVVSAHVLAPRKVTHPQAAPQTGASHWNEEASSRSPGNSPHKSCTRSQTAKFVKENRDLTLLLQSALLCSQGNLFIDCGTQTLLTAKTHLGSRVRLDASDHRRWMSQRERKCLHAQRGKQIER